MFKHALKFLCATLAVFTVSTHAAQWQEGIHYEVIAKQASDDKQVLEIFSYWCPTCYRFEVIIDQLKKKLPAEVDVTKAHVNFMGYAEKDAQDAATLGMLASRAMKQEEKYNQAIFSAIHEKRQKIEGMDDIVEIVAQAGGDAEKLRKLTQSFGIKGQFGRNAKLVEGARSVPTFIVNGKYQAKFTRDMTPDDIVELLIWLSTQS